MAQTLQHNERLQAGRRVVPAAGRSYRLSTGLPNHCSQPGMICWNTDPYPLYAVPIPMRPSATIYNQTTMYTGWGQLTGTLRAIYVVRNRPSSRQPCPGPNLQLSGYQR